jgi:hypothetical protein
MAKSSTDRGRLLLDAIEDDVAHELNPSGDECWHCGGDGYIHDCFDGFCECADYGCEDCTRRCPECVIYRGQFAKAVRLAVIDSDDVDIAIAWLKDIGRWNDGINVEQVRDELTKMRAAAAAEAKASS